MNRRLITLAALGSALLGLTADSASARPTTTPTSDAVWNWVKYDYYATEAECIAMGETHGDPNLLWWIQYNCGHESVGDPRWLLQVYATW
jgi:hypothetical protein